VDDTYDWKITAVQDIEISFGYFMIRIPIYYKIVTVGLSLCILILLFGSALAHGGGDEQIAREKAGPYYVTVWSTSDSGSGDLHFTVAVSDLEDSLILDAYVVIHAVALDNGHSEFTKEATTRQSTNKFRYESDFNQMKTGIYLVMVTVNGDAGKGVTSFEMEHSYREDASWGNVVFLLSTIVLGLFGFLYRSITRRNTYKIVD